MNTNGSYLIGLIIGLTIVFTIINTYNINKLKKNNNLK